MHEDTIMGGYLRMGNDKLAGAAIIGVLQMGIVILAGCNNWGWGGGL